MTDAIKDPYERGFIDGMQEQMKRSVDKAVNALSRKMIPQHSDLVRYDYECDELNGMELACFFEYEEEELGSVDSYGLKNEPDYPASWTLMHVYLPDGTDIFGILHDSILESIQECAQEDFDIQKGEI